MKALTAAQRTILATAGQALLNASWLMVGAGAVLSHDRELASEVVDGWDGDLEFRDLAGMQESIEHLGHELMAKALQA